MRVRHPGQAVLGKPLARLLHAVFRLAFDSLPAGGDDHVEFDLIVVLLRGLQDIDVDMNRICDQFVEHKCIPIGEQGLEVLCHFLSVAAD